MVNLCSLLYLSGCESNRAREFVREIAACVERKVSEVMSQASCFSILSDGSQARKTGGEKELVYVRILRDTIPTYLCVSLQNIDDYGDANAENLKKSLDNAILEKIKMSQPEYQNKMISVTADGASVNTGIYSGLMTRLQKDASGREWLIRVHCISHRFELAFKDTIPGFTEFNKVKEFMVMLYYLFKQSGKLKRQFRATGDAMGVQIQVPKVHGTRFVNHQRQGLQCLLKNWFVLMITIENAIENSANKAAGVNAKLRGVLKKPKRLQVFSYIVSFQANIR